MDYRAHEAQSLVMSDIIYRLAAGYGHERGEAAMEFVMALAIEKIRLHKKEDSQLRKKLIAVLSNHIPEIGYLLDPDSGQPLYIRAGVASLECGACAVRQAAAPIQSSIVKLRAIDRSLVCK